MIKIKYTWNGRVRKFPYFNVVPTEELMYDTYVTISESDSKNIVKILEKDKRVTDIEVVDVFPKWLKLKI